MTNVNDDNCIILSVIIPVYNGRQFIMRCIEALRGLSHSHEILLVDDGSTDGSLAYMQATFAEYADCRILAKENGGIVSARNYGVAQACGRYICFSDQDDCPVAATIDLAIQQCEQQACDMAYWTTMVDHNGKSEPCDTVLQNTIADRNAICNEVLPTYLSKSQNQYVTGMGHLWGALFRRDTIIENALAFKRFVGYEDDYLFLLDYLTVAQRICFIRDIGYYWVRYNVSTSAQQMYVENYWTKMTAMYSYVYETCHQHGIVVPITMDVFVRQSLPLHALKNYASMVNPNRMAEVREWRRHMQNPEFRTAFDQPSIRNYTGRDRRIFELLHRRMYTLAICYVYIDSFYHHLRASLRR